MPIKNKQFLSLDPKFQPIVWDIMTKLEAKGWQPFVAEGRRTQAQQNIKVATGVSWNQNSKHLYGLAADIVDQRYLWKRGILDPFFYDLSLIVRNIPSIRWGGVWDKGPERYHLYDKAIKTKNSHYVSWKQIDVAHVELKT